VLGSWIRSGERGIRTLVGSDPETVFENAEKKELVFIYKHFNS
jgi:hypothetical protein